MARAKVPRMDPHKIGERIQQLRLEKGLKNQEQLAQRAGLSHGTVSKAEQGKRKDPAVNTLAPIAAALGVSVDFLLYGDRRKDPLKRAAVERAIERAGGRRAYMEKGGT